MVQRTGASAQMAEVVHSPELAEVHRSEEAAMPVIECVCGMVMSVSSSEPRRCCIRCNGIEFRAIEKWGWRRHEDKTPDNWSVLPAGPAAFSLAGIHATMIGQIGDGACI